MISKRRTWEILEAARPGDRASRIFDVLILALIVLNVVAVIVGTMREVQEEAGAFLRLFEYFSVAVFSLEYLARLWSAPADPRYRGALRGRLRWATTPMAAIDLLAVLPFYLPFLGADLRVARSLRLLRIFRVAKLGRYVGALRLFSEVARSKREELMLTTFVAALLLVISSSLMFYAEHDAQPDAFSSIPATMWWAIATLTTVGYGDVYPVTPLGKLIGAVVAVLGIGLFALPTAILGSGFVDAISRSREPDHCPHCGEVLD